VYVIDVEGYEESLLGPVLLPTLYRASVLVEVHEFIHPGITERLVCRFQNSHDIKAIWQEPRSCHEFPWKTVYTYLLPKTYLNWAVSEWRPIRMNWLWMKPKLKEREVLLEL